MIKPANPRPWSDQKKYWITGKTLNDLYEKGVVENRLELSPALAEVFIIRRQPGQPAILELNTGVTIADCPDA